MHTDKPLRIASFLDTAIDWTRSNKEKYLENRLKPGAIEQHLVAIPGQRITVFVTRRMPRSIRGAYLAEALTDYSRHERCFEVGVEYVEHAKLSDGRTVERWSGTRDFENRTGTIKILHVDELDLFPDAVVQDVGSAVWASAFLAGTNAVTSQLPRLLQPIWDGLPLPSAVIQSPSFAVESSAEPEPAPQTTSTELGASPIAATATTAHT